MQIGAEVFDTSARPIGFLREYANEKFFQLRVFIFQVPLVLQRRLHQHFDILVVVRVEIRRPLGGRADIRVAVGAAENDRVFVNVFTDGRAAEIDRHGMALEGLDHLFGDEARIADAVRRDGEFRRLQHPVFLRPAAASGAGIVEITPGGNHRLVCRQRLEQLFPHTVARRVPVDKIAEDRFAFQDLPRPLFRQPFGRPRNAGIEIKREGQPEIPVAEAHMIEADHVIENGEIRRQVLAHKHDSDAVVAHIFKRSAAVRADDEIGFFRDLDLKVL